MTRLLAGFLALSASVASAEELAPPPRLAQVSPTRVPGGMPLTGLAPAKIVPDLCVYKYPLSTSSPQCQAFCDQGFGYFYSYVWMEAARSFETALKHDPDCALACLMLHRSLEKWGKTATPDASPLLAMTGVVVRGKLPDRFALSAKEAALSMAKDLMPKASHREKLLIQSRLEEKGMWPDTPADARKKKAQETLDLLLTLHEDDEEAWFWRAHIADGPNGAVPFYKALLRLNPLNPGANHELVHFFENAKRPALGWANAEGYIKSSPGIPHAFHMQAHLAMRIGKWEQTSDWSSKAIELQKAYHRACDVKPADDHQYYHHLEILTRSLVHDGRFAEAKEVRKTAEPHGQHFRGPWLQMALATQDWAGAEKLIEFFQKSDKSRAAYLTALLALEQGDTKKATAAVDVIRQGDKKKATGKSAKDGELRQWEAQGRLMCVTGQGEAGVKLLKRAVDKTKADYAHHAWAGGGYYMESWGIGALDAGLAAEAEEAFQEALAHDSGSVRGALGLWALCSRLGRTDEAERYLKIAHRCWAKADAKDFERLKAAFAAKAEKLSGGTTAAAE